MENWVVQGPSIRADFPFESRATYRDLALDWETRGGLPRRRCNCLASSKPFIWRALMGHRRVGRWRGDRGGGRAAAPDVALRRLLLNDRARRATPSHSQKEKKEEKIEKKPYRRRSIERVNHPPIFSFRVETRYFLLLISFFRQVTQRARESGAY